MAKRNWLEIKKDWLGKGCPKLTEYAAEAGIPYGTLEKQARRHKWRKSAEKLEERVQDKLADREAERIALARERHIKLGLALQVKGATHMSRAKRLDASESIRAIKTGIDIERDGLGISRNVREDAPGPQGNSVQFNQLVQIIDAGNGKELTKLCRAIKELDEG